jgi:hypothetical protein
MEKPKTKPVTIKAMPIDLWWEVKAIAAKEETSVQQYLIDLLKWVVAQDKKN